VNYTGFGGGGALFTYEQCRGRKATWSCFEFNCILNAKLSGSHQEQIAF